MSYITTVTGKHFDPMEPETQEIDLEDIAHALSLLCRANGHFRHFYSVAQHSIACAEEALARGYTPDVILGCLLHDASEAYLCDVTRPVKGQMPQYLAAEKRLQKEIWKRLIGRAFTKQELEQIFAIDDHMLSMEFHQLMPEDLNSDYRHLVKEIVCATEDPQAVKERFIQMATLDIEVERLLEDDYWIIDVFPAQISESKADEYFATERSYRQSDRLTALFQRYAAILCLLSEQYRTALYCLPENQWTRSPDRATIERAVAAHVQRGCVQLLLPDEHALLMLNGDELHMTVFHPSEAILSALQKAAAEQAVYLWQPPQIERIKHYERCLTETQELLRLAPRSAEENKRLQVLINELAAYYESVEWRRDFEADEAGLLPKHLQRGVLSEDGIDAVLEAYANTK